MLVHVKDIQTLHNAMQTLCDFLQEQCVPTDTIFDSKLIVSELVGNVLRHSQGTAKIHGKINDGFVELHILSSVTFVPLQESRLADVYAEHGRGLYLVDELCAERTTSDEGGILVRIKIVE